MIKLFHGTTDVLYDKFIKRRGLLPANVTGWCSIWKDKKVHLRDDVIYLTELFGYAVSYGTMIIDHRNRIHKNVVVLEVEVSEENLEPEEEKKYNTRLPAKTWDESLYYYHSVQTTIQPKILRIGRIPYTMVRNDKQFNSYLEAFFDRAFIQKEEEINDDEPTIFEQLVASDMYFAKKFCNWENIEHPLTRVE